MLAKNYKLQKMVLESASHIRNSECVQDAVKMINQALAVDDKFMINYVNEFKENAVIELAMQLAYMKTKKLN